MDFFLNFGTILMSRKFQACEIWTNTNVISNGKKKRRKRKKCQLKNDHMSSDNIDRVEWNERA